MGQPEVSRGSIECSGWVARESSSSIEQEQKKLKIFVDVSCDGCSGVLLGHSYDRWVALCLDVRPQYGGGWP